jgi:hypothetical protein
MEKCLAAFNAKKEELRQLRKQIKLLEEQRKSCENELEQMIIDQKLYHPIEELETYEPGDFISVEIVYLNEHGDIETQWWGCEDILEITDDHKFYCSDYGDGILGWCEEKQIYTHHLWGGVSEMKIIGFYNFRRTDDDIAEFDY